MAIRSTVELVNVAEAAGGIVTLVLFHSLKVRVVIIFYLSVKIYDVCGRARATNLFDDASVHVISKLLVDLRCLAVNSFIEWMATSLVPFVKVKARNIRNEARFDDASNFRHLTKSWIVNVQPQRIFQIPVHEGVIKGMQNSSYKHCLAIRAGEDFLVLLKLCKEDGSYLNDEVDKLRVLDEIHDLSMLPSSFLDSVIDGLDERFLGLRPARRSEAIFYPGLEEAIE